MKPISLSVLAFTLMPTVLSAAPAVCKLEHPEPATLHPYVGLIHAHTKYSDGDIHALPADVFAQARAQGLDFAISTDHSDTLNDFLFITTSAGCEGSAQNLLSCLIPENGDLTRWRSTGEQAVSATQPGFSAIRGFEWTSDRFGHINVAFSSDFTNALLDQGYLHTMDNFWAWLSRMPTQTAYSGGADGLGIFNHPDDKLFSDYDPGRDWNHLEFVPSADDQMVGMELFNSGSRGTDPNSGRHPYYFPFYLLALANGWHVGAVAAEDMHDTTWGDPSHAKTVILATENTPLALYEAMRARRTYAVEANTSDRAVRIEFSASAKTSPKRAAGTVPMGARLDCASTAAVTLTAHVTLANGDPFSGKLSIYDRYSQSHPLQMALARLPADPPLVSAAGADLSLDVSAAATPGPDDWYVLRVDDADGNELAYTSPIWVRWRR